jgi:hypothetical protein
VLGDNDLIFVFDGYDCHSCSPVKLFNSVLTSPYDLSMASHSEGRTGF